MYQINTHTFYDLGNHLRACFHAVVHPIKLWIVNARAANELFESLLAGDAKFKLDESRATAENLRTVLKKIIALHEDDGEATVDQDTLKEFNEAWFAFQPAIQLELGRAPIFYVTAKGVYDTRRLIADAKATYEGYADRLPPETLDDTNEAGKCLAFALPTAAGFHIARATESVIKEYMKVCNCPDPEASQRNWGNYINELKARKADAKITNHLTQIKDLHRNPVTHPEVTLTMPEAIALWAVCTSVIQSMVGEMEKSSNSQSPAVVALAPPTTTGE